jgi:hypothetical protein
MAAGVDLDQIFRLCGGDSRSNMGAWTMANSDVASLTHRLLPILEWAPGYRRDWLLPDVAWLEPAHQLLGSFFREHKFPVAHADGQDVAVNNHGKLAKQAQVLPIGTAQRPTPADLTTRSFVLRDPT